MPTVERAASAAGRKGSQLEEEEKKEKGGGEKGKEGEVQLGPWLPPASTVITVNARRMG